MERDGLVKGAGDDVMKSWAGLQGVQYGWRRVLQDVRVYATRVRKEISQGYISFSSSSPKSIVVHIVFRRSFAEQYDSMHHKCILQNTIIYVDIYRL